MRSARKTTKSPARVTVWLGLATLATGLACAPSRDVLGTVAAAGDGSVSGDTGGDGRLVGRPRFAPPTLVTALSDAAADDEDPSFTGDLTELYFSSTRSSASSDIWVSHRASRFDPWGSPTLVTELSSAGIDRSPSVSFDGYAIWFASDREPFRGRFWRSTRASLQAQWTTPVPVSELASPNFDSAPSVDTAQTTMFFASLRQQSATGTDIYSSTRATVAAPWSTPERVPGLDTLLEEADPFVAQGGLVVFFTLSRLGSPSAPGQPGDLYMASRRSTDAPFLTSLPLEEVNSPFVDADPALSADLLYLMFASNRSGNTEIYESHALQ